MMVAEAPAAALEDGAPNKFNWVRADCADPPDALRLSRVGATEWVTVVPSSRPHRCDWCGRWLMDGGTDVAMLKPTAEGDHLYSVVCPHCAEEVDDYTRMRKRAEARPKAGTMVMTGTYRWRSADG